jgi:hypothetical protein
VKLEKEIINTELEALDRGTGGYRGFPSMHRLLNKYYL